MRTPRAADAVRWFERRFTERGSRSRAEGARAYMKSTLRFHGVDAKAVRESCREWLEAEFRDESASLKPLWPVVDALLATDGFDLHSAAIGLLERRRRALGPGDLPRLVRIVRRTRCWAHVDWIATKLVPPILAASPASHAVLARWARDRDFWIRRLALVSLTPALRAGDGDFALFERLAAPMLGETEFFIRKAIGWALRETSKKRPALVRAFLARHGAAMSGVSLREARRYI